MTDALIFDFGDVFVNLNKEGWMEQFRLLGLDELNDELMFLNAAFEVGDIDEAAFLNGIAKQLPAASISDVKSAWNSIIGDFPLHRLEFLEGLCGKYRLFLLSNTDMIHIAHFKEKVGDAFFQRFFNCFEKVYYSFELGMRKPDIEVFQFLIHEHGLTPSRTLFIDDKKENTDAAALAGLRVWNLQPGSEDVSGMFDLKLL